MENEFRTIVDQVIVAAMGPPGGGRNDITPRMMRHFNLLCFSEFDDRTLKKIFGTIVQWFFATTYVARGKVKGCVVPTCVGARCNRLFRVCFVCVPCVCCSWQWL